MNMTHIAIQVENSDKAALLVDLLSSLDFVKTIQYVESNGTAQEKRSKTKPFVSEGRERMLCEEAAFQAMHSKLLAKHLGSYVAIFQQQVIDYDKDKKELINRIDTQYPDDIVLIRKVEGTPEKPLVFRSPRFA